VLAHSLIRSFEWIVTELRNLIEQFQLAAHAGDSWRA
jgi:hypothetical protein